MPTGGDDSIVIMSDSLPPEPIYTFTCGNIFVGSLNCVVQFNGICQLYDLFRLRLQGIELTFKPSFEPAKVVASIKEFILIT